MTQREGIILFDMTRLLSKSREPSPTGIDRVDLRYARFLSQRYGRRCAFVVQQHGRLYLYDPRQAERAIGSLWDRWIVGKTVPETPVRVPRFTPPGRPGDGTGPARPRDAFRKEDIDFLFHLSYDGRVKFVMTEDLRPHVPGSLWWFLRIPAIVRFPVVLLCLANVSAFMLLTGAGKLVHSLMNGARSALGALRGAAGRLVIRDRQTIDDPRSELDAGLAEFLSRHEGTRTTLVNTSHQGLGQKALFFELKYRFGTDIIFFIHDIIPVLYPEYVRSDTVDAHHRRLQTISEVKPLLIVNSRETRRTIDSYFEERDWPKPRSKVAIIGVEDKFLSSQTHPDDEQDTDHFVMLGTIEPRKNHLLILALWRDLVDSGIANPPKLFVIGRRGWENENIVQMLDRCPAVRDHVIELSSVSDRTVTRIMKSARALLFPSFAEGWGMPVAEALSMGVPAICSDIPVLHEVGQGVPEYIHPLDFRAWRETILAYSEENSLPRARQLERLKSYAPPRWEDHWKAVVSAVEQKPSQAAEPSEILPDLALAAVRGRS